MDQQVPFHFRQPIGVAIWQAAQLEALNLSHDYLGTEHVLMALTRCLGGYTERLLRRLDQEPATLRAELRARAGRGDASGLISEKLAVTPRLKQAIVAAAQVAGESDVGERELLRAILEAGPGVAVRVLAVHADSIEAIIADIVRDGGPETTIMGLRHGGSPAANRQDATPVSLPLPCSHVARASDMPILDTFGRDLTALARQGVLREVVGRKDVLTSIARTFAQQERNAPVLVGEAGVGKTAIVEGLAARLAQEDKRPVVPALRGKRIIELRISDLVAGASYQGQFEERLRDLVKECIAHPEVILFLDEIHTLVGAGRGRGNQDAAQLLKPPLARGELRVIGATTPEEHQRYIAKDAALERRLQLIRVEEPSPAEAEDLLRVLAPNYERRHRVRIEPETLKAAVELSVRYLPEQYLPAKALDLLDGACAVVQVHRVSFDPSALGIGTQKMADIPEIAGVEDGSPPKTVSAGAVAVVVAERLKVPITEITTSDRQRLLTLEQELRKRVVAQDAALEAVARAVRVSRTTINEQDHPRGVFLFAGPTGVGKTETARALADVLFGGAPGQHLLQVNLAEFSEKSTMTQLIGSPPGYMDSDQDGRLTGWLRRHPYSIVLLDEFEKAHPDIHRRFLALFDEGRIEDAHGRSVNGREAIYILTTNLLADGLPPEDEANPRVDGTWPGTPAGSGAPVLLGGDHLAATDPTRSPVMEERLLRDALVSMLTSELVNRIDRVIRFHSLDRDALRVIAQLQIDHLRARLDPRQIDLYIEDDAREWLVQQGEHGASGARTLIRAIKDELLDAIADLDIRGKLPSRTRIAVTLENNRLRVSP